MPTHHLSDILVILVAAVGVTLLFHRLRISPIIGYLAVGVALGPSGLGVVTDIEEMAFLGELGVVFLLFAIGLEMPISRLKAMRAEMLGLGLAQVGVTAITIGFIAWAMGFDTAAAAVIGAALALSSTATVLRLLVERRELDGTHGRTALSVLLFQDIAVMPMLAFVPLLGQTGASLFSALATAVLGGGAALVVIIFAGRVIMGPGLALVARMRNAELFIATALLILLGAAWLSATAGLSMALGAFVAGVLLAGTSYKHQVEADILPFRGLLLGLFFLSVGMSVDAGLVLSEIGTVTLLTLGLLILKATLLMLLALAYGHKAATAVRAGLILAQTGEFAFVLLGLAAQQGVIETGPAWQILNAVVGLSIIATPFLAMAAERAGQAIERRTHSALAPKSETECDEEDHVIIAGYGRVGRTACLLLQEAGIKFIAVDMDPKTVTAARKAGQPVYFGDASRLDLLRGLGAAHARLAVVTLDDAEASEHAVAALREIAPGLPILARARDRDHGERLEGLGASEAFDEAKESGLLLGERALIRSGLDPAQASEQTQAYRSENYERLDEALARLPKV